MKERDILEDAYLKATRLNADTIPDIMKADIDVLIDNIESNKSLAC